MPFNPEGGGYDFETAIAAGIKPDETGHWPSRDPNTGLLLKGRQHPTFHKTLDAEAQMGFKVFKDKDGRWYSQPEFGMALPLGLQSQEPLGPFAPTSEHSTAGRPIYRDPSGQNVSELQRTFPDPRQQGGWVNFPSVFGGVPHTEDQAVERFKAHRGIDPETGQDFGASYPTTEQAIEAAKKRSGGLY